MRDKASNSRVGKGQRLMAFGLIPMYRAVKRLAGGVGAPGLTRLLRDDPR